MNLIPLATDMFESFRGVLLDDEHNVSEVLLSYLFESVMEAVFLSQRDLFSLGLLLRLNLL